MIKAKRPLYEILSETIQRSRYLEFLKEDPESLEDRRGNLEELVAKAANWEDEEGSSSLISFLEELSLKSSHEEKDTTKDCVRLMTFHNGKGLEFDTVFLVGMEEDLFPHVNARENSASLEEERRLCYVGMTRARKYLYLSASKMRFLWGGPRMMRPSRFLLEIPAEYLHAYHRTARTLEHDEQSFNEDAAPFESGDQVSHKDFGVGVVQKSYQTSLGLTYDVFFPNLKTTRSLVAKYAKLTLED
jgi:DNA helicase-2/ATP-dependent DNA helicase PcrA